VLLETETPTQVVHESTLAPNDFLNAWGKVTRRSAIISFTAAQFRRVSYPSAECEQEPATSLRLLDAAGMTAASCVIEAGGAG
jgi:hypothetical protein